jgi:hypothetical protein
MSMLFGTWVVLFGPATESCTYVIIAPFVAWLLADAIERLIVSPAREPNGRERTGRCVLSGWFAVVVLTAALVLSGPTGTDLFGSGVRKFTNTHGIQQIGGLLLLGYLLVAASRPLSCRFGTMVPGEPSSESTAKAA